MIDNLDENYWSQRYQSGQTGWDIGYVSTPLKAYIDQLSQKDITILIPGSGNSYEAAYLFQQGFKETHVLDLSETPLRRFKGQFPEFPDSHLLHQDFFSLEGSFDLIIEQTFFCALDPSLRPQYVDKMLSLLKGGGKLVGLLFNIPLNNDRPPFGGNRDEYLKLFEPHFHVLTCETCYNSIPEREGNELFMILEKPKS